MTLGQLRESPVQCAGVIGGERCRAFTRNPNCFCGLHQKLTRVPRFQYVYCADVLAFPNDELEIHLFNEYERKLAMACFVLE